MAALTFLAALTVVAPASPGVAQTRPFELPRTIDDIFASVSDKVPDFAGMFVDEEQGSFTVAVKGSSQVDAARAAALLRKAFIKDYGPLGRMVVTGADYTFNELKRWYGALQTVFSVDGVHMSDINEQTNRLVFGVSTPEAGEAVARIAASQGIPAGAVVVERSEPEIPLASLTDRIRPLLGGIQIQSSGGICTMGLVVIRAGVKGILTNSHCTAEFASVDGTVVHQSTISGTTNRVGFEVADAPLIDSSDSSDCPVDDVCRYADASFIRLDAGIGGTKGLIARPSSGLTWTGQTYQVVSESGTLPMSATVIKVGRTTGRTTATVNGTCRRVEMVTVGVTMLCQTQAPFGGIAGDSGSPIFRPVNHPLPNDVSLAGITWGGSTFSPISWIQLSSFELGPLDTCYPSPC